MSCKGRTVFYSLLLYLHTNCPMNFYSCIKLTAHCLLLTICHFLCGTLLAPKAWEKKRFTAVKVRAERNE